VEGGKLLNAATPYVEVPGDNLDEIELVTTYQDETTTTQRVRLRIMGRSGSLMGISGRYFGTFGKYGGIQRVEPDLAVWRFGFHSGSEQAKAYGVSMPDGQGFMWVLATAKTGKVKEIWYGYALDLPDNFRRVIDWPRSTD
jgi:hypothetical protein